MLVYTLAPCAFCQGTLHQLDMGPFTDRAALRSAMQLYCRDPTQAVADNGPIENWDVSAITDMTYLISTRYGCASFNGDISSWNVGSVTNMGVSGSRPAMGIRIERPAAQSTHTPLACRQYCVITPASC